MNYTGYGSFIVDIKEPFDNAQSKFLVGLILGIVNDLSKEEIIDMQDPIVKVIKNAIVYTIRESNYIPIKSLYDLAKKINIVEFLDKDLCYVFNCIDDNTLPLDESKTLDEAVKTIEIFKRDNKRYRIEVINKNKWWLYVDFGEWGLHIFILKDIFEINVEKWHFLNVGV